MEFTLSGFINLQTEKGFRSLDSVCICVYAELNFSGLISGFLFPSQEKGEKMVSRRQMLEKQIMAASGTTAPAIYS